MAAENIKEAEIGSAFDLAGKSWELVKKNWQMFAVVNILAILAGVSQIFENSTDDKNFMFLTGNPSGVGNPLNWDVKVSTGLFIFGLIVVFIFIFLYAMSTKLELAASKGKVPDFQELLEAGKKYWLRLFLLTLAIIGIIGVGLLLLIVPGVIAIGRIIFAPYVMFDKDLGVVDSIKESNRLAKGRADVVWAAIGVMVLVGLAAALLDSIPVVGALISTAIAIAFSLIIPLRYLQVKKIAA